MILRTQLGRMRQAVLSAASQRPLLLGNRRSVVSFTFDDFPRSASQAGAPILEGFGVRGTYYAAPGLMNSAGELGDFFIESDLHALVESGHEIALHTYDHISARSVSASGFQADVQKGMQAVNGLTGGNATNFAYPFGHVTFATKKAVGNLVTSARGVFPGFNGPEIDLNLLRANCLYGDLDQLDGAKRLIEENVRRNSWLIFYTHDVRRKPSQYGCTPELLEAVVSIAAQSSSVLAISEVLRYPVQPLPLHSGLVEQINAL